MLELLVTLVVVGFLLWLINTYVPMDAGIKRLIQIVVIFAMVLYVLQFFGLLHYLGGFGAR